MLQPLQEITKRMDQLQTQLQNMQLINTQSISGVKIPPTLGQPVIPPATTPTTNKNINPKTGLEWKRYCWSCGCCAHWSKNCPAKKPGHKDDATFRNCMDGSNVNYLSIVKG